MSRVSPSWPWVIAAALWTAACSAPTPPRSAAAEVGRVASVVPSPRVATLRTRYGIPPVAELQARSTAVVLVDFQEELISGGLPVAHGREAVARAAALRDWAHREGILVVDVRNVAPRPDAPLFAPGSRAVAFVPELAPAEGDLVLTKSMAGAFSRTDLDATLQGRGVDTLIVAGVMTHLAVDTTVRDAAVRGYRVVVAGDACATRSLGSPLDGHLLDAAVVHEVALAALADRFADVSTVEAVMALPVRHEGSDARGAALAP